MSSDQDNSSLSQSSTEEDADPRTQNQTGEQPNVAPLKQLKGKREWEFAVPTASGEAITCKGSEPDNEQQVSEVIQPVGDAELLYKRTVEHLHEEPSIPDEDWKEVSPTNKALIAAQHLHHWNVYDLISAEQIEEAKRRIIEQQ